ncbi:MAG: hypothetical protein ACXITR_05980 [Cyanobacterium sp.]
MLKKSLLFCPWIIINGVMAIAPNAQASEISVNAPQLDEIVTQESSYPELEITEIKPDINFFEKEITKENELISQSASDLAMEETNPSSNSWHFLVQPSIYIPFTIYGDVGAGSLTGDFSLDSGQIRKSIKDDLNFAFFGRMKAWNPDYRLGFFADFDYLSLDSRASVIRNLPSSGGIPVTLNAEADSTLWSLSLGGAYRFYDPSNVNPEGVETEFDLGRTVFDVFGGINITGVDLGLNFSSPQFGRANFSGNKTVVSPIIGGRARVNVSPQLAWVSGGSFSGFGIEGLKQWNLSTGVDWKFSDQKTSLGLGYRFGNTRYESSLTRSTDFEVDVNQNGPYVNISFRF